MAKHTPIAHFSKWKKGRSDETIWLIADSLVSELRKASPFHKMVADRNIRDIVVASVDVSGDLSPSEVAVERQIQALFSKNSDFRIDGVDPERSALQKFLGSEVRCRHTNKRFVELADHDHPVTGVTPYFSEVQRKISVILGPVPDLCDLDVHFGPGTNVGCSKKATGPVFKLLDTPTFSNEAIGSLQDLWSEAPYWAFSHKGKAEFLPAKLSFVPKNCKTHRPIMIEGILTTFFQLGIGSHLKARLKRFGCDLSDQSRNVRLAYIGSVNKSFATIDLASASDTIAYNVVRALLPEGWFDLLVRFRSGVCHYPKGGWWTRLEKFSSMGNGFTFELESLIFYSIALTIAEQFGYGPEYVTVYGDDIIVPDSVTNSLIEALDFFGFEVNSDKSFHGDIPFRESCGSDYYLGQNVRPFYVKGRLTNAAIVNLLNHTRSQQLASQRSAVPCMQPFHVSEKLRWLEDIPAIRKDLLYGTEEGGDGHVWLTQFHDATLYDRFVKPHIGADGRPTGWKIFSTYVQLQRYPRGLREALDLWRASASSKRCTASAPVGFTAYLYPIYRSGKPDDNQVKERTDPWGTRGGQLEARKIRVVV